MIVTRDFSWSFDTETFCEDVWQKLESANWHEAEFAVCLGRAPTYFRQMLSGQNHPGMGLFIEVCNTLDMCPADYWKLLDCGKTSVVVIGSE